MARSRNEDERRSSSGYRGVSGGPSPKPSPVTARTSLPTTARHQEAGLLGSMARIASSVDNTMMESFRSTMRRERLDSQVWETQAQLASAIFEWIEAYYNPVRRHTSIGDISPVEFEALHIAAQVAA